MCARLDALGDEVEALDAAGIDAFHLDVMDGHFVPNLALSVSTVAAVRGRTRRPLEVHLMVESPERYVDGLAAAGADLVFFHPEATAAPVSTARAIGACGMRAGLALGPGSGWLELLAPVAEVLVMGVVPGFAGGAWLADTPERIAAAALRFPGRRIHLDGHVDAGTARAGMEAGASAFVCGTRSLFTGVDRDYGSRLRALRLGLASVGTEEATSA
jgi:ribulose-phosphate 3-epimerase